jgi:SHAQKYF class myb-like DNA-binding protein
MGSETHLGVTVTASPRESASEQSGTASAESRKTLPRIASTGSDLHRATLFGCQPNVNASYSDFIAQQQQYHQQQRSMSGGGLRHSSSWGSFVAVPPCAVGYNSGSGCMPALGTGLAISDTSDLIVQNTYLRNELNRAQAEIQALRNRLGELEMSPDPGTGLASRAGSEKGPVGVNTMSVPGKGPGAGPSGISSAGATLSAPSPLHLSSSVPYGGGLGMPAASMNLVLPNNRGMAGMPVPLSSSPLHLPAWRPDRFSPSPPPGTAAAAAYSSSITGPTRGNVSACHPLSSVASSSSGRLGIAAKTALARHDSLGSISKDSHNSQLDEYGTGGYSSSSASSHRLGERRRAPSGTKRRARASSVGSAREDSPSQPRYWTPEEHQRFLKALEIYGSRNVRAISEYVGTRNATQVRTHAQKYFLRLSREAQNNSSTPTE